MIKYYILLLLLSMSCAYNKYEYNNKNDNFLLNYTTKFYDTNHNWTRNIEYYKSSEDIPYKYKVVAAIRLSNWFNYRGFMYEGRHILWDIIHKNNTQFEYVVDSYKKDMSYLLTTKYRIKADGIILNDYQHQQNQTKYLEGDGPIYVWVIKYTND